MTASTGDPIVGRTIAQYDVLARVGGGGMGVVYRARDKRLGRTVALKFLPPQWSHDEDARQRFIREAQAASATNHQNICTIHDIETAEDGQLFIVMAYYEGQTLKQRLASGPLPVEEALDIATQIADGLAKAHAQGVVHRDVKPGNVMLTEDGVRILDFGLATFADVLKLTVEHSTLGTAAYMSPEQVRGQSADARSDVWAAGVILYEMLTGHVPFQGSHAEAIAYAVTHETPAPVRASRPEIGEEVEQLVFRAMHKEPSVRFTNGRELARALRQARGQSLPLDLRTAVVNPPSPGPAVRTLARRRLAVPALIATVLVGAAGSYGVLVQPQRVLVAIAPFANQTGDEDLEQYRLALTLSLTQALRDSPEISAVPYARVAEIVRRFQTAGSDMSDRDAIAAIDAGTEQAVVLVPTLLRTDGEWRARVELRNSAAATTEWTYETAPRISSLNRDTAYQLAIALAGPLQTHFSSRARSLITGLLSAVGFDRGSHQDSLGSVEAAKAFEEGTTSYDALEFASARRAFALAVEKAPRSALARAWLTRARLLLREDISAAEDGERAESLLTRNTPEIDRLFVQAVAAEARRDYESAETAYRALASGHPREPVWAMELGGFFERRVRNKEAVEAYLESLRLDRQLLRPRLELCRLYSPSRLNEPAEAHKYGQEALDGYRASGLPAGEGQTWLCRADTLRVGSDADRSEARRAAERARVLFSEIGFEYNVARAEYYLALVAGMQGRSGESVSLGQQALAQARSAGNVVIQPLILLNLGSAQLNQGDPSAAAESYREAYELYQEWREETRAAQIQANRGSMLIDYGTPDEGLRDVRNALAVFQKYNDRDYEVFCLRAMATYYTNQGRHQEAVNELGKARAIALQWKLTDKVSQIVTHLAVARFEMGEYVAAQQLQLEVLEDGTDVRNTETRIRLARTRIRLGDLDLSDADLRRAEATLQSSPNPALQPLILLARGEWAYESGRVAQARDYFTQASALWSGVLPEVAAVEARAYLGMLQALEGNVPTGIGALRESLTMAERLGRLALVTRCRLLLAELEVTRKRFDAAQEALADIPSDADGRSIGPELRASAHFWQGRIQSARGDSAEARNQTFLARSHIDKILSTIPDSSRSSFTKRFTIKPMFE